MKLGSVSIGFMKKYLRSFFPADEVLGIDIGSYAIKFVLFSKEKNKIFLKNWGYIPLNLKDLEGEAKKSVISNEIENYIKKHGIKTKYAATSISGNSVIVRYVKFPKMDKKEIEQKINAEAETYIPFDINDVYLSYYVLNDNLYEEAQNKMEVVLVAAKKEVVNERLEILEQAGVLPVCIDVDSFALENVINLIEVPNEEFKSLMIVNMGNKVTNLSILQNNLTMLKENPHRKAQYYSKLVRDIFVAGTNVDRVLSKKLNIEFEKVDEFKKVSKLLVTDEDKLEAISNYDKLTISSSKVLCGVLKELVNEITRSIDFYTSSGGEGNISKIYICGGLSSLNNISLYLSDELKVSVEYLNPFLFVENKPSNIPQYILNSLSIAAGLSLRSIEDL